VSTSPFLTRSPHERFYHPELDVLRFFSFFFIFIHHSMPHDPAFYTAMGVPSILAAAIAAIGAAGAFGVQLFFLLSAYLVTELLIRERALRGRVDLKAFFVRRILRIWPLYFAFLAFAWAMQYFIPGQHIGWRAELAFIFLGGNWWIVFVGFPSSVIFPLWCISIEEQFYLFWPATMRKLSTRGLLIAAACILAVASLTRCYLGFRHTWESRVWCNTFAQLDAIGFGIILAVLLAGHAPRLTRLHRAALFVGGFVCLFLAGSYFRIKFDPVTTSRLLLGYPVAALGAVSLFLATLRPSPEQDLSGALKNEAGALKNDAGGPFKPSSGLSGVKQTLPPDPNPGHSRLQDAFVYLGRISYGLYTFHIVGLMTSDYAVAHQDSSLGRYLFRNAVALAVTIVLASVSYRWLESPFLSFKQRFTHVLSRPGG
jgi:peptidoglycan/LPS O-acetylase OafA/YrhL